MLEEKASNFKALKVKIKNVKLELDKKHQKLDEEETQSDNKFFIRKNHKASVIVKELERDYKLYLEGHHSVIASIKITSDNKYIISGGYDCTIRI